MRNVFRDVAPSTVAFSLLTHAIFVITVSDPRVGVCLSICHTIPSPSFRFLILSLVTQEVLYSYNLCMSLDSTMYKCIHFVWLSRTVQITRHKSAIPSRTEDTPRIFFCGRKHTESQRAKKLSYLGIGQRNMKEGMSTLFKITPFYFEMHKT